MAKKMRKWYLSKRVNGSADDMTDEQITDSFIKAVEQLEWIAKAHHDTIVRTRNLHTVIEHVYGKVACKECGQAYPCRTIKILDGETK
jgi:hypothetical protein